MLIKLHVSLSVMPLCLWCLFFINLFLIFNNRYLVSLFIHILTWYFSLQVSLYKSDASVSDYWFENEMFLSLSVSFKYEKTCVCLWCITYSNKIHSFSFISIFMSIRVLCGSHSTLSFFYLEVNTYVLQSCVWIYFCPINLWITTAVFIVIYVYRARICSVYLYIYKRSSLYTRKVYSTECVCT